VERGNPDPDHVVDANSLTLAIWPHVIWLKEIAIGMGIK
jgi:hypothetical protein